MRRSRAAPEEVEKSVDGIGDVGVAVAVDVQGVRAKRRGFTAEEDSELCDGVGYIDPIRAFSDAPTASDCNGNRVPDGCDLDSGVLTDADGDGVPDECAPAPVFVRGDSNASGIVDLSDAVFTLRFLFVGGDRPPCLDAADTDDSGVLELTDAVFVLNYLFRGGMAPPAPDALACGPDPSPDDLGDCAFPPEICP